jgi:hypothetical protein
VIYPWREINTKTHKFLAIVQLHVVRELLDAMGFDLLEEPAMEETEPIVVFAICQTTSADIEDPSTFHLMGQFQKKQVLVLVY